MRGFSRVAGCWGMGLCALGAVPAPPGAPGDIRTSLPSNTDLARLCDLVSSRLGLRLEYDAATLKSKSATIRGAEELSDADLWQTLNALLESRGLTTVRNAGVVCVVEIDKAAAFARVALTQKEIEAARRGEESPREPFPMGFQAVVLKAKHRRAGDLIRMVTPLLSKVGAGNANGATNIAQLGDSDLIVLTDLTSRIEQIRGVLGLLDQPDETAMEEVKVTHVTASQAVALAKEIAGKRDAVSAGKADTPTPAGPGNTASSSIRTPGELVVEGPSTILIVAPAGNVPYWKDMLERADKREALETRSYVPKNFAVREVSKLIEQVARESPVTTVGGSNGPSGPASSSASGGGDDRWKLITDELTGTIILTATPMQHERVAALMERLDSTPSPTRPVRAFPIRNRPVKEVVEALNEILSAGYNGGEPELPGAQRSPPGGQTTATPNSGLLPGGTSAPRPTGPSPLINNTNIKSSNGSGVQLNADEGTNTLIAVGEPRTLAQIEQLLAMLDRSQPQVMLEVFLVSMTDGQSRALGVELDKFGSLNGSTTRLSSLFTKDSSGAGTGTANSTPGLGFTGSILSQGEFSLVFNAFEGLNIGRSASLPKLLVKNNEQATFNSVDEQPTSTVSTNTTSTTVTGFGGFQDAGTKISIKPQITQGDRMILKYNIELSSFTSKPSGGLPGAKQQNSLDSVVEIPDGHTVVVGGLEVKTDTSDTNQVPWVGDVPILGWLFKNNSVTNDRTRFYVFIRANVMRSSSMEDLKYVSLRDAATANVDDGAPTVAPRVIK